MPTRPLKVFLCHSSNDKIAVRRLYKRLVADGIRPWLDEVDLLGGVLWEVQIQKAIESIDVVIVCLSQQSSEKGYVHQEIEYALSVAEKQPVDAIFIIPLRLEQCEVPERLRRWQRVDLFSERGYDRLIQALQVRAKSIGAKVNANRRFNRFFGGFSRTRNESRSRTTVLAEIAAIIATIVTILAFLGYNRWDDILLSINRYRDSTTQKGSSLVEKTPVDHTSVLEAVSSSPISVTITPSPISDVNMISTETSISQATDAVISNQSTPTSTPTWLSSQIAFTSMRDGNQEIYVMDSDGSNPRRVTDNQPGLDYSPTWSPDGQRIAFVSTRSGNDEIYTIRVDGTDLRKITNDKASDQSPAWSPDGQKIAFVSNRDGNNEIYVMSLDGKILHRITNNSGLDMSPTWSPDGKEIAFDSEDENGNREIYIAPSNGIGSARRITNNPREDSTPAWSPDGKMIAFTSNRMNNYDVFIVNKDGSKLRNMTMNPKTDSVPVWSPDSSHIAFQSNREGNFEIYTLNIEDDELSNISQDDSTDYLPAWSMN